VRYTLVLLALCAVGCDQADPLAPTPVKTTELKVVFLDVYVTSAKADLVKLVDGARVEFCSYQESWCQDKLTVDGKVRFVAGENSAGLIKVDAEGFQPYRQPSNPILATVGRHDKLDATERWIELEPKP
jgi:hypothetical protein